MGRTLIVGDIHGCSRELRKLIDKAQPTRIIAVGDLFTRGPDPRGVWKLIQRHDIESVLGNTDLKVIKGWRGTRRLPRKAILWLENRPFLIKGKGFVVVHAGVHPTKGWKHTTREMALTMRRWPNGWPHNPMWWDVYKKKKLIVHGHTAREGLVDRRPRSLGLDTACVYGGRLTGYLVESDELVSVRSHFSIADRSRGPKCPTKKVSARGAK